MKLIEDAFPPSPTCGKTRRQLFNCSTSTASVQVCKAQLYVSIRELFALERCDGKVKHKIALASIDLTLFQRGAPATHSPH